MIIVQNKRKIQGYTIPVGGEIMWYDVAANLPGGWSIDSFIASAFVRGVAAGQASNTPQDDFTHGHTNPATTGTEAAHTHPIPSGSFGGATGSDTFFGSGSNGSAPSGHGHTVPTGTSGSGGGHSHALSSAAAVAVYPSYVGLYWIKSSSEVEIPLNGVILWDAAIGGRPSGFEICDGTNGTPDLRNKFVYGAASDGGVGATGGADTHTHQNSSTGSSGTHTHSLSVVSGGSGSNPNASGFAGMELASPHSHTPILTSNSDADHSHTIPDTGSASSLPAYVQLYYIMRVS